MHQKYIDRAIILAGDNIDRGGGPFGAVVVRKGEIVAEAANQVTTNNDPTAHAEVMAIRLACEKLGTYDLSDCVLYASCEPCPMCLGAVYWARIPEMYYASGRDDAKAAGFDDKFIYDEISLAPQDRSIKMVKLDSHSGNEVFQKWKKMEDKLPY